MDHPCAYTGPAGVALDTQGIAQPRHQGDTRGAYIAVGCVAGCVVWVFSSSKPDEKTKRELVDKKILT